MSKPAETTLREARETDLAAILELAGQPGMDDGVVLDIAAARAIFQRIKSNPAHRIFVADRSGEVVGTYALLIMENLGHLGAPSAIVEQVLVAPDRQGAGIGMTMMRHVLAEAREAGCYKLTLSSNLKRVEAHAFYDGLGFTRHGYSFRVDVTPDAPA